MMSAKEAMKEIFKHVHFTEALVKCPECGSDKWHLSENGKLQCSNCNYYTKILSKIKFKGELIFQKVTR